jgi:hypothetical protein
VISHGLSVSLYVYIWRRRRWKLDEKRCSSDPCTLYSHAGRITQGVTQVRGAAELGPSQAIQATGAPHSSVQRRPTLPTSHLHHSTLVTLALALAITIAPVSLDIIDTNRYHAQVKMGHTARRGPHVSTAGVFATSTSKLLLSSVDSLDPGSHHDSKQLTAH